MRALVVLLVAATVSSARADTRTETTEWYAGLTDRVIADLVAGKPLVAQVHVPLCDNTIIRCGNAKLGDGDNPDTNLYWSTTPGFGAWFTRRAGGWTRTHHSRPASGDIVAIDAYRRTLATPAAWRKRGAPARFVLALAIHGWRGKAIDPALAAYAADVSGQGTRAIALDDGTTLDAGGAAQIVAWVGHNRLMDLEAFSWPAPGTIVKGTIAIACATAPYMATTVSAATRVPLLMTRDLLFANAAPLEAAVLAFATGGDYRAIWNAAATAYAAIRKREVGKIIGAFTNPADRRWHHPK